MTQKQNMYDLWKAKELPEPYQGNIDSRLQFCKSEEERLFTAGFFVSKKIKEIRKALGVEE